MLAGDRWQASHTWPCAARAAEIGSSARISPKLRKSFFGSLGADPSCTTQTLRAFQRASFGRNEARRCEMRVAVMAAGAVGGYFGGRMAAAGHDVAFIARGAHRDAIRQDGLKVESALGDLHLKDVNVTDNPKQVGPVDVVLFAVKLWDTETAGQQTRPLIGPNTRVITLQNGVDSVERLAPILGDEATIGGATYVVTTIARPGVIRHTGTMAKVHCGRLDRRDDAVLASYVEQMKAAAIDITLTDQMLLEIWKKFVVLSGTSGITASTRQTFGVIRDDEDMCAFFYKLMHETIAVGRAAGVEFPPEFPAELAPIIRESWRLAM